MKRFLKIFVVAAIAVAAAVACVFAGCKKDNGGETKSDYNFTIVYEGGAKDGQAVKGQADGSLEGGKVATQICLPDGACAPLVVANIYPDANGKLSLSQEKVNELFSTLSSVNDFKNEAGDVDRFVFHAIGVKDYKNDCEIEVNGKGDYTLKITVS